MARGTTLIDPTLDLCSNSYKSDSGRQARRQVIVNGKDLPYQFLSTEVVKYVKVEDASFALNELKSNYLSCMDKRGFLENGIFIPYEFVDIEFSEKMKRIDRDSLVVLAKIGGGSGARNLLAVYTFKGQYFSGLYAVKSGQEEFGVSEVYAWLEVASVMASRL